MIIRKRDALDTLNSLDDESCDLILLDPFYNEWDSWIEKGLIELAMTKLKDTGNLICFTAQPFDFNLRVHLQESFRRELIWHMPKRPKWVSNQLPLVTHQKVFWAVKTKGENFFQPRTGLEYSPHTVTGNKGHMVFRDFKGKLRPFEKHEDGIWLNDVQVFDKPHNEKREGAKPLELIEVLIRCLCPIEGKVVDPFGGSGVTCYACQNLGITDALVSDIDFTVLAEVKADIGFAQQFMGLGVNG